MVAKFLLNLEDYMINITVTYQNDNCEGGDATGTQKEIHIENYSENLAVIIA